MPRLTMQNEGAKTYQVPASTISPLPEGFSGDAINRLGAYEAFHAGLVFDMQKAAADMEILRAAGKEKTVKFRELLAKKLTCSNTLALLKLQGLDI